MTWTARSGFALITLGSLFAFAACGDDDDTEPSGTAGEAGAPANVGGDSSSGGQGGAAHGEVPLECRVLGELCHASDTGPGPSRDCHELGHVGNAQICAAEFDGCIATCTDADVAGGDDARCAALGSLCHDAGEVDADAEACHELGHVGNAADCATSFVECATLCLGILEELEEPGAGGAAGAGGSVNGGGAGGGANGGAGGAP